MASCNSCGADWDKGEFTEKCGECGGGALTIPCPRCAGRCGAIWQRAVIDSNQSGAAHFIGHCNLPSGAPGR
ncbi:MAG TPA: hypothetical protein VNM15_07935 [Candidatus Binatia bacterium]|nr:hypothetical protein [Candidatus Binatia bacterium]